MIDPSNDPFDERLRSRLERLTQAIPVDPPATAATRDPGRAPWRPRSWRVILVTVLLVSLVSLGAGAALLQIGRPSVSSSAFAAGGPLHCSGVDQLTPREAATWMTAHGLLARWQVEDRAMRTFDQVADPPEHGAIINALELSDGTLLVLVDIGRDTPLPPRPCP